MSARKKTAGRRPSIAAEVRAFCAANVLPARVADDAESRERTLLMLEVAEAESGPFVLVHTLRAGALEDHSISDVVRRITAAAYPIVVQQADDLLWRGRATDEEAGQIWWSWSLQLDAAFMLGYLVARGGAR